MTRIIMMRKILSVFITCGYIHLRYQRSIVVDDWAVSIFLPIILLAIGVKSLFFYSESRILSQSLASSQAMRR